MSESPYSGRTVADEYPEIFQLLETLLEEIDIGVEPEVVIEQLEKVDLSQLENPHSITNIENLSDMLGRTAESVVSCMYDIIDNGISAQLTKNYLLEAESGESAKIDVSLELDADRDIVWFRVQDVGRGIEDGELKTAVFGGGKSGGEGLLNHFGVGLLVALCYFERSVDQNSKKDPDWVITTKTSSERHARRVTGPINGISNKDIEQIEEDDWKEWRGQLDVNDQGTRVEIPIPFDHLAAELENNENLSVEEIEDEEPANKYLYPYAQRLRRRIGRDYRPLLADQPFVQDDKPVKIYFEWEDNYYKDEIGSDGNYEPASQCRVLPLEPEFEEPGDHIEFDWPVHQMREEIEWETENGHQEAWYHLKMGYLDEEKTIEKYDIEREDVDSRIFGGTRIRNSSGSLGDVYRPSNAQQGITITVLGRAVAPNNMDVVGQTRNPTLTNLFGYLDIIPKEGSDVPEIMKAHKQDIEEGGSAWESIQSIFEDLPIADLQTSNWQPDDEDSTSRTSSTEEEEDETSTHDRRKEQTHNRFKELDENEFVDEFKKEYPTSGYKTDNLAVLNNGTTEVVEQKDGKLKPGHAYKKIGELAELANDGYSVDKVKFRVDEISRDNESAIQRGILSLVLLHEVEVEVAVPDDDAHSDSSDQQVSNFAPSDIESDQYDQLVVGALSEAQNKIQSNASEIDIEEF